MLDNKDCWLKDRCNHRDCNTFCMRHFKLDSLYEKSLIPPHLRKHLNIVVDRDMTDLKEFKYLSGLCKDIVTFVNEGKNLYIHSTICGNGKTSWALRIIESYFDEIWFDAELSCKALFINVPRFLLAIKEDINEKSEYVRFIKSNIDKADIVVWDDIGTKTITSFESENLLSLIERRYALGKSNVFTSNLSKSEMHQYLGDRLYSRICNMSIDIEFHGGDKRGLGIKK